MPLSCPSITPYKINCPFVHCPSILGNCPPPLGDNMCWFQKYYRHFICREILSYSSNIFHVKNMADFAKWENNVYRKSNGLQLLIEVKKRTLVIRLF